MPGYHCWAEFYLPGRAWLPVDASDASRIQDAARRDYLFGDLDPDRIQFSRGRNVRLDPLPCSETLNYFIYPYAEGGRQVDRARVDPAGAQKQVGSRQSRAGKQAGNRELGVGSVRKP